MQALTVMLPCQSSGLNGDGGRSTAEPFRRVFVLEQRTTNDNAEAYCRFGRVRPVVIGRATSCSDTRSEALKIQQDSQSQDDEYHGNKSIG